MNLQNNAAFWMVLTGILSVIIVAIAKEIGDSYHPFQIMFFYCLVGAMCLLPAIGVHYGCNKNPMQLNQIRWRYHLIRSVLEFAAFSLTFYSLTQLPLPMQTAIGYTVPLFASLFAVLFVGEIITPRIMISLLLGLVGICIIHNPFASEFSSQLTLGVSAAIAASAIFGLCGSLIKLSTRTTPPILIAMFMLTFTAIVAAPFAINVWQPLKTEHLSIILLLGISTASVQYSVSKALSLGMVTKLVPLTYLNLIWASILAYLLFNEIISERTILGSIFIFGAVMFVSMGGRKKANALPPNAGQL